MYLCDFYMQYICKFAKKNLLPSFLYLCVYFSRTKLVHTAWDLCVESLQEIILTPLYIICIVCISFIQHKNNKNSSVKHQMDQIALYGYFCAFQLKSLEEEEERIALKKYLCMYMMNFWIRRCLFKLFVEFLSSSWWHIIH